jgi:hypothetical protein
VQQLAQLLGDLPGRGDPPAHVLALEHAADHLRRCLAALAAVETLDPQVGADLGRLHGRLRDELAELERLRGTP